MSFYFWDFPRRGGRAQLDNSQLLLAKNCWHRSTVALHYARAGNLDSQSHQASFLGLSATLHRFSFHSIHNQLHLHLAHWQFRQALRLLRSHLIQLSEVPTDIYSRICSTELRHGAKEDHQISDWIEQGRYSERPKDFNYLLVCAKSRNHIPLWRAAHERCRAFGVLVRLQNG